MQPGLTARIIHDDVAYIEIRRGEGIDGGDTIVVAVERPQRERGVEGYYVLPLSMPRLNRYRMRMRVTDVEVLIDDEVRKQLESQGVDPESLVEELKSSGRLAFVGLRGRYPRIVIELIYGADECKARIKVLPSAGGEA